MTKLVLICSLLLFVCYWAVTGTTSLIGIHAGHMVGLTVGGFERISSLHVRTTLDHYLTFPQVRALDPRACELFRSDLANNDGFFAVLALGDAHGKSICTADPTIGSPLPSMADRLYFRNAKESTSLVVGEYALSRTTGKPVLHYAYPIRDKSGTFLGLILAAVNLDWFVDPEINSYFESQNVQVLGVDHGGKLLFGYPTDSSTVGTQVMSTRDISSMLSARRQYRLTRGYDGIYRVYAYKKLTGENDAAMFVLVGIPVTQFAVTILFVGILSTGTVAYIWYLFIRSFSDRIRS